MLDAGTLALAFAGGLAGSLHCVGMCGVFPVLIAGGQGMRALGRLLLYNLARVNALVAIGGLSGALGGALMAAGRAPLVGSGLALVAGAFMVAVGLETLGVSRRWRPAAAPRAGALTRAVSGLVRSPSPLAPLTVGACNALLPCHLVYAFAAHAATAGSVPAAMLEMLAFGLGTVPAMVAVGCVPARAVARSRGTLVTAVAVLIVAGGALTIARGLGVLPGGGHAAHGG